MRNLYLALLTAFALTACAPAEEPMESVYKRGMEVAVAQGKAMAKQLENQAGKLPRSAKDGKLITSGFRWWCSGFFPGELWYLYEYNKDPELLRMAEMYTKRVENVQYITSNHDVGFMLYCSYGNGYRITQREDYKKVLVQGARSLSTRYSPKTKTIQSWGSNRVWQYPVIIDNMMNLELLTWAGKATGEKFFTDIAVNHANTTIKHHFRPDYSSYHVVSYDTVTGLPHKKQTHQGYSDDSDWSRGQSWGLYGYTMMYRETGKKEYLEHARHIAAFLMNNPNMPADKIPYWDYKCPDIPNTTRDASAAAVMASGLLELAHLDVIPAKERESYRKYAEDQLRSMTSPEYLANPGENNNFVLKHSTGYFKGNSEVDAPLSYADYYYVEALMRWKKWFGKN